MDQGTVQIIAGILAVVCIGVIIMRRKAGAGKSKADENDF